jgi:diguanylate cyclase
MNLSRHPGPLRSRFGRRLLLLFVGCAVVPTAVVATVSYRHVTQYLIAQSETRLHQASKTFGAAIFERLLLLDATLKNVPVHAMLRRPASGDSSASANPGLDLAAARRFTALEFLGDDGVRIPISGHLAAPPRLTQRNSADLADGLPLLAAEHRDGRPTRIYMVRRISQGPDRTPGARGLLIGEINSDYLWATFDQSLIAAGTILTVQDDSGRVLMSSVAGVHSAFQTLGLDARPDADSLASFDRDPYVSSTWPMLLDEVFAAPTWTLVLGHSKKEVLGPVVRFADTLLVLVLVSTALILILSVDRIRRSLVPLRELQEGTRRIAGHDFGSRVSISSRDEFEELGASFNAMAGQLDRQFQALATAAEIDRAVLSATSAGEIVATLLARLPDVYPCGAVSVTLMTPDGAKSLPSLVHDYSDGSRTHIRVDLRSDDVQELLDGPDATAVAMVEGISVRPYLVPLAELGCRTFFLLPLRFQSQLVGVIALADRSEATADSDARVQVRRLADQAAVALANARMLDQVRNLAYYDSLTGLPNRLSYKERLANALEEANRDGTLVAAFFIDLDHFSRINDTLGHEAGDHLLQQVAGRLRASCREREDEVGSAMLALDPEVARLGGDEFTVIMPGLADPQDAGKLARRILASLAHPFRIESREIFINASIGIAVYPFDGQNLETLLMHADTAMYKAKEQGGNSYQAYSRSMNATALQRLTLENSLRRALEREEFEVHYQPIVNAQSGTPVAAEALVRWRHPDLGLLLPSEFIALAEENGLIVPLGEWVMRTACAQNLAWQRMGLAPIRVVVNLSSRQLTRTMTENVARILRETGLESRYLGLELTETVLVNRQKEGVDTLHALRAMGLHLSVDDFGTGYSSFSYLKHFPLDTLKIDRAFIREITSDPDDAAISTAIIALGHALGLTVTAEGVETEAQVKLLRQQGCDEMQGYFFSRPVRPELLADLLAAKRNGSKPGSRRARSAGAA